ncbi:thioesterase family protein [Chitinophaga oryzae]|uniref:Thioesterase family protein n=1 Tax=Chitinophaga oryzae TaxID=2725414 RepID=A0AAE6ZI46_9BACT|nr:thioesterase family protein [Chitinophaga oryzae]QJB33651.1 thioesterase family protein [Chitinophaga oryzae]QJB40173.1 thioesterase family protein [Chitinophaga oryzae]
MARIKIDLPAQFGFSTTIPIRIQDVNYGGHVGNDAILSIMHEARMQFLQHAGYKELDHEAGTGLIMADVAVTYKGEGFHGDIFTVEVAAGEYSAFGFELFYQLTTQRNGQTITIATAKTGMVCFDYNARKVMKLPAGMKMALESPGAQG